MYEIIKLINRFLWNGPVLCLLLFVHIFFTIRLRFIQKKLPSAILLSIRSKDSKKGRISGLASLATTLAATLGTGNIIGISTAIAYGGFGAVFWCWITGVLGMATSYAECYLGVLFRKERPDGSFLGGPMTVWEHGLSKPKMARIFCYLTLLATFGVGCSTQANAAKDAFVTLVPVSPYIFGIVLALLVGFALSGGGKTVATVCTYLVPVMGIVYLLGCLVLIVCNITFLPLAVKTILSEAFSLRSVTGGIFGSALMLSARYGIARGLFTNEAGLGSAPIAAAAGDGTPQEQALIIMSATFWDTVVMCGLTGLVIACTVLKNPSIILSKSAAEYTLAAFETLPAGKIFLLLSVVTFAYATLIGWSFFGEKAVDYLFGSTAFPVYRICYLVMIFIGAVLPLSLVWELCDFLNALMAVPNLISLLLLRKRINTYFIFQ